MNVRSVAASVIVVLIELVQIQAFVIGIVFRKAVG